MNKYKDHRDKAREERDKLYPDKKWGDVNHVGCARMGIYYEKALDEDDKKINELEKENKDIKASNAFVTIKKLNDSIQQLQKENKESKKYSSDLAKDNIKLRADILELKIGEEELIKEIKELKGGSNEDSKKR